MIISYNLVEEREENGLIYQKLRFYEGDITTELEYSKETDQDELITRYRRTSMIEEREYWYE